jgi:hypothetical protein
MKELKLWVMITKSVMNMIGIDQTEANIVSMVNSLAHGGDQTFSVVIVNPNRKYRASAHTKIDEKNKDKSTGVKPKLK